ncbi:HEAT repeat-containing protein 1-like [Homarus americanus]|uniref:HEAT repeat-containing protein 1 n=1 Tax=Homarus americanus TaxID=6706 RepID=A0A8J5JT15_HOMAM|nr:HEAT repeat-containing protein 1-like [Homarus americanus]
MATSLATQLEKLKTPQTSILDEKRIRRSILFDSSEAAKYGRDILYEIGVSGFDELAEINSKFLQFKESLFGKTSKEFQRAVEDKATNRKLDENIEHFLLLLFMINSMNIRALLMCIFPYYESALFIRVLQIIEHDGTEEWRWLKKAKKSGRPLTKQAVSTRWGHNQGFRKFLVEYLKKMLKVHSSEGNLKIAISFYFTTVVGGICLLEEVEEMHLSSIVQMLPKCLSSHCEIVAGMYFTIAQLSVKTKLSQDLINNILRLMIQENTPPESLMEQCVLCLLALTHHQKIDTFNYKTLMALEKNSIILKQIEMLAKTKSVAPFLSAYVTGYIRWLGSDSCELDASKKAKKFTAVIDQLESMPMSSSDAFKVLSFFEAVKNNYKAIVSFNTLNLGTVLSRLEASHPEGHCQAVARMINKVNNSPAGKEYEKIIKVILTSQSGSTSFIHMVHPDDEIRLAAVKNFVKNVSKGQEKDTIVIKKHLKNMLTDEFPAIILEGLTFIKGLRMLDVSYIVNECQKLLTKSRGKGAKWGKSSATKTSQNLEQPSLVDLEEYLEQVEGGAIPLPFLTQCLQQVVKVFRLPDFCSTLRYWHPDMESPAGEGNLMLLMKAMKGALQLERCGDVAARNSLVAQILEECLGSTERRYYFLTILWGWHGSHTFSNVIDETLQAWALSLGSALLGSQSVSLAWALGTSQPIVPALISALTHGSAVVRSGAIDCIKKLVRVIGGRLSKDNHYLLLEAIVMQADELIADGSHVSSLLAQFDNKPKSNSQQVAQALIGVVVLEKVPMHMKASLLFALSHVTSTAVLRELLPLANSILKMVSSLKEDSKLDVPTSYSLYYILLHFTPETCEVLESKDGWELFHKAITCSRRVLDLNDDLVLEGFVSPQSVLMDQVMSSKFFSSIRKEEVHSQLWSILISHVVESEDPSEATHLRKGLRKVSLDAAVIIKQIEALHLSDKVTSIKAAQAKRKRQKEQESHSNKLLVWRKLGLMLETIGVMASLGRPWLLVGPLCQCLLYTLTLDTVITDVVQQQILSALLHLLQKSVEELGEDVSKEVQLNIELIVQCIRSSVSPDTHRRAMLILAFAAKISPDVVMHNMMSIFTFMGTSLLRRDDSYSFQVIHQTIQSIVPTLIQCEEKKNLVVKLAQVCQVFVDALPDLPEHRRLSLFTQLTSTIDAGKNLWIILALMADSHIKRGNVIDATVTKEEERRGPPEDIQFALILCSQFSPVAQVYACCQLMKYINNLLKEKEDMIVQQSPSEKNSREDNDIICWDLYSLKQKCHFKYISTGIIAHLLSSDKFIGQVYEVTKEQEGELQDLYKQLLETTLCYLQTVTLICDQHKDKPRGRLFLSLQRKVVDVVDSVNAVLAPTMLIEVTKRLMTSPLPLVRCRALEIMCAKLQPNASFFSEEDIESLEPFIKILRKVALNSKEPPDNRQTALFTLHLLTKLVASQVPEKKIQSVLAAGVNLVCGEEDPRLMTQALLVVSEAVVALKAHCIAHLGQLMPIVIKLLDGDQDSEHLLLAAVTATHKLFENVPQLLSPYLESLVCGVCRLYTSKEGASAKESRLVMRLGVVRDTLVKQIEPRVLIPKLTKAYKILSETEVPALQTFMVMVERLVTHVDGKTLMSHKPALLNLFTQAMDLRTQKGDSETICTVEMNVSCALGKLLLRLNEHDNIAIFLSLQSWAVDATEENPSRLITFYRLADHVAGTFKVLFIIAKLADRLFSHAAGLLDRNNSLKHKDTVFGSGDEAEGQTSVLLQAVFDTLTKIFLYDSVNFTNQERFQLMVKPLTDQLENTFGSKEDYRERITNHLVPCITKFAIAIGDDSLWKTLNRQILLRVRNDDQPMVILAALETFRALMETLGEDFLQPLLADTMPYITEVLESTDPDVEAATREIFTNMEGILGDNLRAYLEY